MSKLSLSVPIVGEKVTASDPKIIAALTAISEWANGNVGIANIENKGVTEAMLSTALQEKLAATLAGLTFRETSTSETVASGEFIYATKTGTGQVITLPTPTANRNIAIFCGGAPTSIKVKCSSGKIYGDFTVGSTEVTLTTYQHIRVSANGSNWLIEAGRTSASSVGAWSAPALGAKVENGAGNNVEMRLETSGATARLRGVAKIKAGQTFNQGETFATGLPVPASVHLFGVTAYAIPGKAYVARINLTGALVTESGGSITEGVEVAIQTTYPLT